MSDVRDAAEPADDTELAIEGALRPTSLGEFVGQQKVRGQLQLLLDAARIQNRPPDHILLAGPPGLGKTTLAMIVAHESERPLRLSSGPAIQHAGDLAALLSSLVPGEVLFIDEIHRMARSAEEMLYLAMEDFRIDIMVGKGAGATSIPLDLAPFTLVGATTRSGLLPNPLRDRFGFTGHLEFYDEPELERVIDRSALMLRVDLPRDSPSRSPAGRGVHRESRTACSDGCATMRSSTAAGRPRCTGSGPRSSSTTSTRSASTVSTAPCSRLSCVASAAGRSASARSRWLSARRRRPSRAWSSRTSCASDSSAGHRVVEWPCRRPTPTWGSRTPMGRFDLMTYNH